MGDPDFVEVPLATCSTSAIRAARWPTSTMAATPSSEVGAGVELQEEPQTTHFSVGGPRMAVSNTLTLNGGFGAKVKVPGTGVTLNNEIDDFTAKVGALTCSAWCRGPRTRSARQAHAQQHDAHHHGKGRHAARRGRLAGKSTITTTVAQIIMQLADHDRTSSRPSPPRVCTTIGCPP